MKISLTRIKFIFTIQTILFILDILFNTFSIAYKKQHSILLIFFIVQDVCLILALSLLLLTFFSTYVFQAGLIELLYDRFRLTICLCVLYFILTTTLYIWILCNPSNTFWSSWLLVAFIAQRLMSPFYYYFYKRAALKICDPRFYNDANSWDQNQPNK